MQWLPRPRRPTLIAATLAVLTIGVVLWLTDLPGLVAERQAVRALRQRLGSETAADPTWLVLMRMVAGRRSLGHPEGRGGYVHTVHVSAGGEVRNLMRGDRGSGGSRRRLDDPVAADQLDRFLAALPRSSARPKSPDDRLLVAARVGERVEIRAYDLWNLPAEVLEILRLTGRGIRPQVLRFESAQTIDAHADDYGGGVAILPDGVTLVTAGAYGSPKVWDLPTLGLQRTIDVQRYFHCDGLLRSPDGRFVAAVTSSGPQVFDTAAWQTRLEFPSFINPRHARRTAFSGDGRLLLVEWQEGLTGYVVGEWSERPLPDTLPAGLRWYADDPAGRRAVVETADGRLALWDVRAGTEVAELDPATAIHFAAFSPDGRRVAVASKADEHDRDRIRVWDAATGSILREFSAFNMGEREYADGLLWSADSRYLLGVSEAYTGESNRNVHVWSLASGRHRADLTGPVGMVTGLVMSPDGQTLIASCTHGKVRVWDLAAALRAVDELETAAGTETALPGSQ